MSKQGYVYIITNKNKTVLYTGVTSNLEQRIYQHKSKLINGFTKRYNCELLLWHESADCIETAIIREKKIKAGSRKTKEALVNSINPDWQDLAYNWFKP